MKARQLLALSAGRATACLPLSAERALWRSVRLIKANPVVRHVGLTRAGVPGSMIVAGLGPADEYLPRLFFSGETERTGLGHVPVSQLSRRLREWRKDADLTVARVDVALARTLFGPEYLEVPEWVRSVAEVPETMAGLSNRSNSLRQDLRLTRKYGYTAVESRSETDVVEFYETMFRPHTLARHESAEYLKSLREIILAWHKGVLLWILLDGRRVAGIIVSARDGILKLEALGTLTADETLLRKGVLSAAYLRSFEYARQIGCTQVDFGATRPSLNDSLLRYKRKWGATLDPQSANYFRLLTYWPKTTPSITAMLNAFPLVFKDRGELSVVHGAPEMPLPTALTRGVKQVYVSCPGAVDTGITVQVGEVTSDKHQVTSIK